MIGLEGVLVAGILGGFSLKMTSPLTFLVEPEGECAARTVLRLIAGLGRPRAGTVRVDARDPAREPSLRREIALLGDAALLEGLSDAEARGMLPAFAAVRGVSVPDSPDRIACTDLLAAPERARVVLLSHPERYVDAQRRRAAIAAVEAAIARGAQAIVATHRLDALLTLAHGDPTAPAHLLGGGRVALSAPAHYLPWSLPARGATRVVRLVSDDALTLAAQLLADPDVAPLLASIEPISARELRLHARDARMLVRAIAARAHVGRAIEALDVTGASPRELLGGAP